MRCTDGEGIIVTPIRVVDSQGTTVYVEIGTDAGIVEVVSDWAAFGDRLILLGAHIQGLHPGALGRKGLNEIARRIMDEFDVEILEIYGAVRTTGRNPGRPPKPIRIARGSAS